MMRKFILSLLFFVIAIDSIAQSNPNVIYIYADDLGYGDLSSYGATKLHTPNVDKLAVQGIKFLNAHTTSGTCTPSRYALMTGEYPWRRTDTRILPGDAKLIVPTDKITLPKIFKNAGYVTGIVGKWHLGLGEEVNKNWNQPIVPGPNEVGFDYSFIFPATADRVPTVFMENHSVVSLDPTDPLAVDYKHKIGNDPTGLEHPELLKMKSSPNQGHNSTIVNGIGRIGFMTGGNRARWVDEEVSLTFLEKSRQFISNHKEEPFFLYIALTEPHVPRMPATMFKGKSGLGYRGDAILQLDWTVGQIMDQLEKNGLIKNTIVIFTSDNGPVLDDGYQDGAVTELNGHTPWGVLRGGKCSTFEAGTRVPFILSWPERVKAGQTSTALVCQMDLLASFANLLKEDVPNTEAIDSKNMLDAFLGKDKIGRDILVEQGYLFPSAVIKGDWKYIYPSGDTPYMKEVDIETGNSLKPQLYNLKDDLSEKNNLANKYPEKVKEMEALFLQETRLSTKDK